VVRDRVVELVRVKASKLRVNAFNPRVHTDDQKFILSKVLGSVGMADALIGRRVGKHIEILDGHLRADLAADAEVPVLLVDLTEEEAELFLLTFDPVGAMARQESGRFHQLRTAALCLDADVQETMRQIGTTINSKSTVKKSGDAAATRSRNVTCQISQITVPVTPEEIAELTLLMNEYGEQNGSLVGFGMWLLRALGELEEAK
jgi:hypothetical protein